MIKLQFKLPQPLISRGFTRRTVFHAPAFQQKGINQLMDIYQIWKPLIIEKDFTIYFIGVLNMATQLTKFKRKRTLKRNNITKTLFINIDKILHEVYSESLRVDAACMFKSLTKVQSSEC